MVTANGMETANGGVALDAVRSDEPYSPLTLARHALRSELVEERRRELSALTGIPRERMALALADLRLLLKGVFYEVNAVGLGQMRGKEIPWEAFGLQEPQATRIRIAPPRATMVPDEFRLPIERAADQARAALDRIGYEHRQRGVLIGMATSFRWVRAQAISGWQEEFDRIRAIFLTAKRHLLDNYDDIRAMAVSDIVAQASAAVERARTAGRAPESGFIERVRAGFLTLYPSPDDFAAMEMRLRVAPIFLSADLEEELARSFAAERQRFNEAAALRLARFQEEQELTRQRQLSIFEETELRERLDAERRRIRAEEEALDRVREENMRAMREAFARHIPLELELRLQDLALLDEMTGEMIALIEKRGFLPGPSRRKFLDTIALLRAKAVWLEDEHPILVKAGELAGAIERASKKGREEGGGRRARSGARADAREVAGVMERHLTELRALARADAEAARADSEIDALEL